MKPIYRCFGLKDKSVIFKEAVTKLDSLKNVTNQDKLKLYGLYKQATVGNCNIGKPSVIQLVNRAKWQAWMDNSDVEKDKAMESYANFVTLLSGKGDEKNEINNFKKTIDERGVCKIELNNGPTLNSISKDMYIGITEILNKSSTDDAVKLVTLSGIGKYYSSGNDISSMANDISSNLTKPLLNKIVVEYVKVIRNFVSALINFPKPIVVLVNGPAFGITVTTLPLCDYVLAVDTATFKTPFTSLALCPEGCSSYTFPMAMGDLISRDVLLYERTLTAEEALQYNLVNKIEPMKNFKKSSQQVVENILKFNINIIMKNKKFFQSLHAEKLNETNEKECNQLIERLSSWECAQAAKKFMSQKGNKS